MEKREAGSPRGSSNYTLSSMSPAKVCTVFFPKCLLCQPAEGRGVLLQTHLQFRLSW